MRFILFLFILMPSDSLFAQAITPIDLTPQAVFQQSVTNPQLWPNQRDLEASWQGLTETQRVRFRPVYGITRQANIDIEMEVDWRIADARVDWDSLRELSIRAQDVWARMESCYRDNLSELLAAYRDRRICSEAASPLRELKSNTRDFLASTTLIPYYPESFSRCARADRARGSPTENCNYISQELERIRRPSGNYENLAIHYLEHIDRRVRKPILHPLLVQIILENVAQNYPFLRVMRICGGSFFIPFACQDPSYHFSSSTGTSDFGDPVSDLAHKLAFADIERTGSITARSRISSTPVDPRQLEKFRIALVGLRALAFFSVRESGIQCAALGLWPREAVTLFHAMIRSTEGPAFLERQRLLNSSAEACGVRPTPMTHFNYFMRPPELEEGVRLLARTAAWRGL